MVIVENRHHEGVRGIYIGRGTIWGNKYRIGHLGEDGMTKMGRDDVIALYLIWLRAEYKKKGELYVRLNDLAIRHRNGEIIVLVCSCKPLNCHGDVLKMAIEKIAENTPA